MAAYAALVSLMHTIQQIQHHLRPSIFLDEIQAESLTETVTFLKEYLEGYSQLGYSNEADELEMRIADAAYAAEDVVESHIVDHIHAGSTAQGSGIGSPAADQIHVAPRRHQGKIRCFSCFRGPPKAKTHNEEISSVDSQKVIHVGSTSQGLEKVIQGMDLIKKEAMAIKETSTGVEDLMRRKSTPASSSTRQSIMVGLDDVLIEIMDKLTDGQLDRRIIPIVGMGGSGKTTLAKNVYRNLVVVQHFDILVWLTVSHEYRVRELLLEFLSEKDRKSLIEESDGIVGQSVHKRLSGRRYLIVLDDIWDIEVVNHLKMFFPDNSNGSRIVLTTRLSNLASEVANSDVINIGFLDEDSSWDLFSKVVFGEEGCPNELEEIGKNIVRNCRGLPLAIVVVGGLLAKTEHKQAYWEPIVRNLSSAVNSEDDESCLRVLYMSYTQLPVYLKSCFLYMGVFQEDDEIRVSTLVKLWIAEGFLKPIRGKSLEIVANEYLKDLIDRNLILVNGLGSTGNVKFIKIHDLLRDLCLREAQKERFYTWQDSLRESINSKRRIVVFDSISKERVIVTNSGSPVRSLIWDNKEKLPSLDFRLLRILKLRERYGSEYLGENNPKFLNSRYIDVRIHMDYEFPSSVYLFWNLQTLIFHSDTHLTAPSEIWKMPQLKHIECEGSGLVLRKPPGGHTGDIVLVNLQKLARVLNFKFEEETIRRIPNVKKLELTLSRFAEDFSGDCCLYNVERLHKLESFDYDFSVGRPIGPLRTFNLPHSLKKLTLNPPTSQCWDYIIGKIGSLPLLEKLKLRGGSFYGHKWETVEGQFQRLKFLQIRKCGELEDWTTDCTHFPRLEHLHLLMLEKLKEIPSVIGDIPTLQSIEVSNCPDRVVISAKEILMEQKELGNEGLQLKLTTR